jgi:3-ketosteroid 9alpha-monooxygenase subunit A
MTVATSSDYALGEFAFPRGWFVIADSATIKSKPYSTRYFGEDVVVFRGESGAVVMLSAYCPHMGTHLGKSQSSHTVVSGHHIEGDAIRCPFHGWRYGPDGKCDDIPYFEGTIPRLARVRSWPTCERYGIVFCWNDPEGLPPDFDMPEFPEWDDPEWMRWTGLDDLGVLRCHPIEVFDNNSDYAHLRYLHGGSVVAYENEIDGHLYMQRVSLAPSTDEYQVGGQPSGDGSVRISSVNAYVGPGINAVRFIESDAAQLISVTPIDDGSIHLRQCAMMRRPEGVSDETAHEMRGFFNQSMAFGLAIQDGEIWANKRAATKVMQMPTDGPFRQARAWYSQFFNPRAKAVDILAPVQGVHHARGVPAFPALSATS